MMKRNKKVPNAKFMLLMLGRIVSDIGTGVQAVVMPLWQRFGSKRHDLHMIKIVRP